MNDWCNRRVYVMECESWSKVGISKSPKKRLQDIQANNPFEVTLFWDAILRDREPLGVTAFEVEKGSHEILKDEGWENRGEWFRCPPEVAVDRVYRAAIRLMPNRVDIRRRWLGEDLPEWVRELPEVA